MPQFDPEPIEVMKKVLDDIMTRVPSEHSTPAAKAYFAECILKAAAQGQTSYEALIAATADQIEVFVSLFSKGYRSLMAPYVKLHCFFEMAASRRGHTEFDGA